MAPPMIITATTFASARDAVQAFLDERPYVSGLEKRTIPFLASLLVLANRQNLSNRELWDWITQDQLGSKLYGITTEAATSNDREETEAATFILRWLSEEKRDTGVAIEHNGMRGAAANIIGAETLR
jgi:hypothetical protein